MEEFKKYDLIPIGQEDRWANYTINGLTKVYATEDGGSAHPTWLFNGACGLIKSPAHPGYCSLCIMHREDRSSYQFGNTGVTFEYAPLYNEDGQRILVKYDRDELFADITSQREFSLDYFREDVYKDYRLSTWIYGTGDMWDKVEEA